MKHCIVFIVTFWFCLGQTAYSDLKGAQLAIREYENAVAQWIEKVKAASSIEERRNLWDSAPDSEALGRRLLREIDGSWDKKWFLDVAPKLLELAPAYSVKPVPNMPSKTPLSVIRDSAERYHFQSEKIGALAIALTVDNGPKTRKFLEKIESQHPSLAVQGQAAMALAILSREMGDGGNVAQFKKQRLDWIRKATIHAIDIEVGGQTIGQMAKDFLFAITKLDKGMIAPDILGWNIEGDAMRLSDYRGKPVMIVFWHSRMRAAEQTLAFLRKVQGRLGSKGLVVMGVAFEGKDSLRSLVKDGTVTWQNWLDDEGKIGRTYQVADYPAMWVLDGEGKVAFNGVPGAFAELTAEALLK